MKKCMKKNVLFNILTQDKYIKIPLLMLLLIFFLFLKCILETTLKNTGYLLRSIYI